METILIILMLLPPLGAAAICGASLYAGDNWLSWRQVQSLALGASGISAAAGLLLLFSMVIEPYAALVTLMPWFEIGEMSVDLAFRLDPLSAVMAALVTAFGFVICRFSINYMHNETGFTRFFTVYTLFLVAMLVLVLADNMMLMFLGWEGVGVCSYLLIGHYNDRMSAAAASTEAFVANRIGDAGIIMAMLVCLVGAGTLSFDALPAALATAPGWVAPSAALGLLLGIMGKSGQVPLGGWLSRAMDGPTPTSALFYGSVMVTSGVYLFVRSAPVFEAAPGIMMLAAIIGALTALYGALTAQASNDVKGLLIQSTSMHLGIMLLLVGLGAYGVAIFYVVAHAFYKAYQFLTAPSILHHLHGNLNFEDHAAAEPLPSGVAVALLAAVVLMFIPPVLVLVGAELAFSTSLVIFAGAATVALALLIWLAVSSVRHALDDGHHEAAEKAATGLGPAGAAAVTVMVTAVLAALVQILPGGANGSWFGNFLGLGEGSGLRAPALTVLLSLVLAVLAAHSVLSTLALSRLAPDSIFGRNPILRALFKGAANRFWIDAVIHARLIPSLLVLSDKLARIDRSIGRNVLEGSAKGAAHAGDAVGWLDAVPRQAAERLPGALGFQLAEASRQVEAQATDGVELGITRASDRAGQSAMLLERALGRPVVSVGLIIFVAIVALAGA